MAEFQRGVRMGVDVGKARVGTALSDPDGILATPLKTLRRDEKKNSDRRVLRKLIEVNAVSYTHLDVYKRQVLRTASEFEL